MASIEGARVLVVGGSSGIGFAVAGAAKASGAEVVIASSDEGHVAAAAARLGVDGRVLDLTDERVVAAFFAGDRPYDHIVSTAGDWTADGLSSGALRAIDLAEARALFEVRFWGALSLAKCCAAALAAGGSLTLTDGTIAHNPRRGRAVSSAMAGAVEHLARALAVELAPCRVNAVCPGLIRTPAWNRIPPDDRDEVFRRMTAHQLIDRVGEPEEVAEAYLYLMRATYTTGQVLQVEGGSALGRPDADQRMNSARAEGQ